MKTERGDDILVLEREVAFAQRLEDYFKNYKGERGQTWPDENETIPLEQATPPQLLPNNLE